MIFQKFMSFNTVNLSNITTRLYLHHSSSLSTKHVFLFPGQGTQNVGMCKKLANRNPRVKDLYTKINGILGYDLLELCLKGSKEKLDQTIYSQPAIFVASLAALLELKLKKPEVNWFSHEDCITAGFSLGEITSLVHAKAISVRAGLNLVQKRAECMHNASVLIPSGMISVLGLGVKQVQQICKHALAASESKNSVAVVASHLSPKGFVISGTLDVMEFVEKYAIRRYGADGIKRLAVGGAFHSPIMKPAQEQFETILDKVDIKMPAMKVYSNVTGKPYTAVDEIRSCLSRQLVEPVCWSSILTDIIDHCGTNVQFYETGPGQQLKSILSHNNRAFVRKYISVKCD